MTNNLFQFSKDCPIAIRELDLLKPGLLEASAGTGKTFAIEHLVLRLLLEFNHLNLKNILILTFTEKATGELKEKIRSRITERLTQGDLSKIQITKLKDSISNFDHSSIFTIHGFCERLLKKYAFENHELFENELEKNDTAIYSEVLKEEMRSTWLKQAGKEEQGLVNFTLKVTALNFGSKKKWDEKLLKLTGEINLLRKDGIEPKFNPKNFHKLEAEILEIVENIGKIFPEINLDNIESHPFIQNCLAQDFGKNSSTILSRIKTALLLNSFPKGAEERISAVEALLEPIIHRKNVSEYFKNLRPKIKNNVAFPIDTLNQLISQLEKLKFTNDTRKSEIEKRNFFLLGETAIELKKKSLEYKQEKGLLTFNDMIEKVWSAIRNDEERIKIIRQDFSYCLVDEFQDTDSQQWEIFEQLFLNSGSKNPLYLIGDPKQAIYRFRGGDIYTYMDARQAMFKLSETNHAQGFGLDTNYRSSRSVIDACNLIFSQPEWFHLQVADIGNKNWKLPSEADPLGYVSVKFGGLKSQNCSDSTDTSNPIIIQDLSHLSKLKKGKIKQINFDWIVSEIQKLMSAREKVIIYDKAIGRNRPIQWNDICILVRTRSEKSQIYKLCTQSHLPVQMERHAGLFQNDVAGEYLAVFEALENQSDLSKQAKALLTQFFHYEHSPTLKFLPEKPPPLFQTFQNLILQKKWPTLFYELLYKTGLVYRLALKIDGDRKIMDFIHIGQKLLQLILKQKMNLSQLINALQELRNNPNYDAEEEDFHREDSDGEKIVLMTYHISKGLEFPIVFVTGFSKGQKEKYYKHRNGNKTIFQLDTSDEIAKKNHQLEMIHEEKRLFYVALTRAKYKLYIPILPELKGNSGCGPLATFVADALRSASKQNPNLFHFVDDPKTDFKPKLKLVSEDIDFINQNKTSTVEFETFPFEHNHFLIQTNFSRRRRKLSSYSTLLKHQTNFIVDENLGRLDKDESHPELTPAIPFEDSKLSPIINSANSLPRGKDIGNMFHEILEHLDFSKVGKHNSSTSLLEETSVHEFLSTQLIRHKIDIDFLPTVCEVVWNTLHAQLPSLSSDASFSLIDIQDRKSEMEFLFPYSQKSLSNDSQGFLNGFIDLVFRYSNRYYFLDWKSNYLINYSHPDLAQSMLESNYNLQYMVYAVAINAWLKDSVPDYNFSQHFGGIYYLYLRGIVATYPNKTISLNSEPYPGIFSVKPSQEQVESVYPKIISRYLGAGKFSLGFDTLQNIISNSEVHG